MAEVTVDIEVKCECGENLTAEWKDDRWRGGRLEVEPCEKCLDAKYGEGHEAGFKEGEESAQ